MLQIHSYTVAEHQFAWPSNLLSHGEPLMMQKEKKKLHPETIIRITSERRNSYLTVQGQEDKKLHPSKHACREKALKQSTSLPSMPHLH